VFDLAMRGGGMGAGSSERESVNSNISTEAVLSEGYRRNAPPGAGGVAGITGTGGSGDFTAPRAETAPIQSEANVGEEKA